MLSGSSGNPFEEAYANSVTPQNRQQQQMQQMQPMQPTGVSSGEEPAPDADPSSPASITIPSAPPPSDTRLWEAGASAPAPSMSPFTQSTAPRQRLPTDAADTDGRCQLVEFHVEPPYRGTEMLRAITYFTIKSEVRVDNDGHYTVPDIPCGPHMACVASGVKRNEWTRGSHATTTRRYNEVLDLRRLLVYQFPTIIIPPLPAKNSVHDAETYLGAPDALNTQQRNISFFLKELAKIPEIMFFSEWIPPFFLDARDSFETDTLEPMRTALANIRAASKHISDLSQRNRSLASDAADRIAATSTMVVRSVMGFFSRTSGGGAESPAVSSPPPIGDWSALPGDAANDARAWERVVVVLTRRRDALRQAAKAYEPYLVAQNACIAEEKQVAKALETYETRLKQSPSFVKLAEPVRLAALIVEEVAQEEKSLTSGRYTNVCMRLAFERHFVESVLDAADHVIALYRAAASGGTFNTQNLVQVSWLEYAGKVSGGLREDFTRRYKPYHAWRMRDLIHKQIVLPSSNTAASVDSLVTNSAFVKLTSESSFAMY